LRGAAEMKLNPVRENTQKNLEARGRKRSQFMSIRRTKETESNKANGGRGGKVGVLDGSVKVP